MKKLLLIILCCCVNVACETKDKRMMRKQFEDNNLIEFAQKQNLK